jgi:hypothetical protein
MAPNLMRKPPARKADSVKRKDAPWGGTNPLQEYGGGGPPPPPDGGRGAGGGGGGFAPSYPILTEELGYPPSPLASTSGATQGRGSYGGQSGGRGALGPVVNKALQDALGWKINASDARGFMGALNQSFQLKMVEGAVVSTWTPRSYAVQTDLAGGITGAQASIYTMSKTLLDQMLPLLDGLYPLTPAPDTEDVAAIKQLVVSQLTNLAAEIGYLGGPRVSRVHQYFQMLLGVKLHLTETPSVPPGGPATIGLKIDPRRPPRHSPLDDLYPGATWPPGQDPFYWNNPDTVLGSLGDLRDQLGLSEIIGRSFINTVSDEQNVTNFRIIVDYANSLLNAWRSSIQFFAGLSTPFLGTQLVLISRQLGVITDTVNEVRFVLDSVFVAAAQRETTQIIFSSLPAFGGYPLGGVVRLPPIYLEDLLLWAENFVAGEAQDMISNGGKYGLGEDFVEMIYELTVQAYGLYLYAHANGGSAVGTARVLQSVTKLANQLYDLYSFAVPVSTSYLARL